MARNSLTAAPVRPPDKGGMSRRRSGGVCFFSVKKPPARLLTADPGRPPDKGGMSRRRSGGFVFFAQRNPPLAKAARFPPCQGGGGEKGRGVGFDKTKPPRPPAGRSPPCQGGGNGGSRHHCHRASSKIMQRTRVSETAMLYIQK